MGPHSHTPPCDDVAGAASFGCTELFERLIKDALGANLAAQYPVPILLGASSAASILAAIAYSPFEALRIRIISAGQVGHTHTHTRRARPIHHQIVPCPCMG